MLLQVIRRLSLDCSTLGKISLDLGSRDRQRRDQAEAFLQYLHDNGWVLVFSYHHIQEFLQHENYSRFRERVAFIECLPVICLVRRSDDDHTGTVVDLHALEYTEILNHGASSEQLINELPRRLFRYAHGSEFVAKHYFEWEAVRPAWIQQTQRSKEIASIARAPSLATQGTLREVMEGRLRSADSAARIIKAMVPTLERDLRAHGDVSMPSPNETASDFMDEIFARGIEALNSGINPVVQHLLDAGVDPTTYPLDTPLCLLTSLAALRKKMQAIAEHIGCPPESIFEADTPIGLLIAKEVGAIARKRPRVDGGDLADSYIAAFAPYVSGLQVDKRTHDAICQIRRRLPELAPRLRCVFRASNYSSVPDTLETFPNG